MDVEFAPTTSMANLQQRAALLGVIRKFFAELNVLEVETPLLCQTTAIDPHLASFEVSQPTEVGSYAMIPRYLQTSPEFAMKRLLAAGSGSIYQISKAFRCSEQGRYHNPEFTLLEWYRVGFDHEQLMDEVDQLLQLVLATPSAERVTYEAIFHRYLGLNPHVSNIADLQQCATQYGLTALSPQDPYDKDFWLHLLMTHCIEPKIAQHRPLFITDFPASQAALAKIRQEPWPVAERFEVYFRGMELANGYHELTDPLEQRRRFAAHNQQRQQLRLAEIPLDERLLAALTAGMPECAGVALGIDRLVLLAVKAAAVSEVISFCFDQI